MDDDSILDDERTPDAGTSSAKNNAPYELQSSKTMDGIVPRRKMSRRHSFHQRQESAPDFFDDLYTQDFRQAAGPSTKDPSFEGRHASTNFDTSARTKSRDSPSSSAIFVNIPNKSNEDLSEQRQRTLHARRKSGTMEDWEFGLKKALNDEMNILKIWRPRALYIYLLY